MSPFAAFETRVNASLLQHLANARVSIAGGADLPGIFRNPSSVAPVGVGMADSTPALQVSSDAVPADPEGQPVQINGAAYVIVRADPDGTGMTQLTVELAP